jgi:adenylate kinase family enzyme
LFVNRREPFATSDLSRAAAGCRTISDVRRVVVIGTSGSGKTWMARTLAARLGVPHVELDELYWEPNWTGASTERLRERVLEAASSERWIVDGNYSKVRDLVWPRADTVVWLDYSLPVVTWRVVVRTLRRMLTREVLWSGNRERFGTTFLSRDSILLWAWQTHPQHRRRYPAAFAETAHAHLSVVRLRSPRAAEDWLRSLEPRRRPD